MSDPKTTAAKVAEKTTVSKPAPTIADADEPVILPKPALHTTAAPVATKAPAPAAGMSSVGAELHPDATVSKVAGVATLDAGGPYVSAAPAPTPAAAVAYPSTGGLPDTGPNSKYVAGTYTGVELYNRDGQRVNADGQLIDDVGNLIVDEVVLTEAGPRRIVDKNMMRQPEFVSEATKAEMQAGAAALKSR